MAIANHLNVIIYMRAEVTSMRNEWKNIVLESGSMLLLRISRFMRDGKFTSAFGIGDTGAAFLCAFVITNLFRCLLGEGALSSAGISVPSKLD
jgi:peptidoglycan biosynthesis protein MviN/MurJ (putative lipid II flippase)